MEGFLAKKDTLVDTPKYIRFYRQSPVDKPDVSNIIINNIGEAKYLLDYLKELDIEASLKELTAYNESALLSWPNAPLKIGRVSYNIAFANKFYTHSEPFCLGAQLSVLKAKKPNRNHYRFLIVNGFGGNLGDSLVGINAFDHVAKVLKDEIGSFSVDILLGIDANPYNAYILSSKPYIENIYFAGLSLVDLGAYDAYFDTTGLINLPNYNTSNRFDWYLWWFGLDPDSIDKSKKRNSTTIHYLANLSVQELLKDIKGKKILFVHKASVPLRTFPKHIAAPFARNFLAIAKDCTLIVDSTLDIKHPRLLDLEGKIDNPEKFKALCAQVDGIISIDSFSLHLADACDKPCVALLSSTDASCYTNYPTVDFVELDNAKNLPAYGKVKVSDEEYKEIEATYEKSWRTLSAKTVYEKLYKKFSEVSPSKPRIEITGDLKLPSFCNVADTIGFIREKPNNLYSKVTQNFLNSISLLLKQGSIFVGAMLDTKVYITASKICAFFGKVIAFEPRRLKFQALCGSFAMNGCKNIYAYESACAHQINKINVIDFDPQSESDPLAIGNVPRLVSINLQTIDSLNLDYCNMIALCAPSDFANSIKGAMLTINTHKPFIAFGPIAKQNIAVACSLVKDLYDFWALEIEQNSQQFFVLATPKSKNITVNGFLKINLDGEENVPNTQN
ncbi:hypothetical protein SAMN05660835_01667 [Desulfurella multipotens]|uniref:Uncharacterized protein n=3 Tax=Desulfurella TaxID=33001 RepID=A0A1G6QVD2_9BACT|nr:hypothetical protein [Desulfurella multipotens]SDC96232.1 hypothetical protein SAMN05660835_01667 [Desulfurella multipotens]